LVGDDSGGKVCFNKTAHRSRKTGESTMQALCIPAKENTDIACKICGARFTLAWSRRADAESADAREMIFNELAQQHLLHEGPSAHSARAFTVPAWSGPAEVSGAALLGFVTTQY
jgi:hypothetical protein